MLTGARHGHLPGGQLLSLLLVIALALENIHLPIKILLLHSLGAVGRADIRGIACRPAIVHHFLQLGIAALVNATSVVQRLNVHGKILRQRVPGIYQHQVPHAVSLLALGIAPLGRVRRGFRLRVRRGGRVGRRRGVLHRWIIGHLRLLFVAAAQQEKQHHPQGDQHRRDAYQPGGFSIPRSFLRPFHGFCPPQSRSVSGYTPHAWSRFSSSATACRSSW